MTQREQEPEPIWNLTAEIATQGYAIKVHTRNKVDLSSRTTRNEDRNSKAVQRSSYRLLHHHLMTDELTGSRHAGVRHAGCHTHTA
jgi:hypothetical protein